MRINNKTSQTSKGFTIPEVLIYFTLLVALTAASITFMFSLSSLVAQYRIETALYQAASSALETITLQLRQGDEIEPGSVFDDASNGALVLRSGSSVHAFAKQGDALIYQKDGITMGDLTGEQVGITGFTVSEFPTANGVMVRAKIDLAASINGVDKSISLYTGGVIRGAI